MPGTLFRCWEYCSKEDSQGSMPYLFSLLFFSNLDIKYKGFPGAAG